MVKYSRKSGLSTMSFESARISGCEKTCYSCRLLYLHIINTVDICVGISLISFTVYLYDVLGSKFTDEQSAWVGWCTGSLGILLFCTAMLSLMASLTPGCRCAMIPSNYLAVIVFLYASALGIISILKQSKFFAYLNDTGLDENQINSVKSWYSVISFTLIGVAIVQLVRLILSISFRDQALRVDNEFKASLLEDERIYEEKLSANKGDREEKYKNLKEYYRLKFSPSNPAYAA